MSQMDMMARAYEVVFGGQQQARALLDAMDGVTVQWHRIPLARALACIQVDRAKRGGEVLSLRGVEKWFDAKSKRERDEVAEQARRRLGNKGTARCCDERMVAAHLLMWGLAQGVGDYEEAKGIPWVKRASRVVRGLLNALAVNEDGKRLRVEQREGKVVRVVKSKHVFRGLGADGLVEV